MTSLLGMLPSLPLRSGLAPVSARLGDVLIASTWQGLLLTAGVAGVLRLWPGLSAAARTVLWTAVLVLVVALPALPLVLSGHGASAATGAVHLRTTLSFGLVAVWAAAAMFRLVQLLMSAVRLRGMLRRAEPVAVTAELEQILGGGRRRVTLCRSAEVDRPSVAGFLRPRVLFPPELLEALSEVERRQIALHEMEHVRRGDDWVNLLQQISLVLLPLNPALLWLDRRLSLERELACDDRVLATTRARKAYAACLARVAESTLLRRSATLVLGVLGGFGARRPELVTRVERILRKPGRGMGRVQTRLATGGLMAGLFLGALGLAHSPQLVAFGPAPVTVASVAGDQVPVPGTRWMLPAGATVPPVDARGPRLVAARATVTAAGGSATAVRPAVFNSMERQHGVRRVRVQRRSAATKPRMTVLTVWQPVPEPSAVPAVARVRRAMIRVGIEDSQVWYTAVAWRDGWLVVQL